MGIIKHTQVNKSPDLARILALPRRNWTEAEAAKLATVMTNTLKRPGGSMALKPAQAVSLYEFQKYGGLVAHLRVGSGKTLVSLLAPAVLGIQNYALIVPASLRDKTNRERVKYSAHWKLPQTFRIWSYEELGRVQGANILTTHRPKLLILDEAHKAKNRKAGVVRRLIRYMQEFPETKVIVMSGTLLRNSIEDFGHLSQWALGEGNPLPNDYGTLKEWAEALEDPESFLSVTHPGQLMSLPGGDGAEDERQQVRQKVQLRMLETGGVVGSRGEQVAASLYLKPVTYPVNTHTEANFKQLRTLWETPDGYSISEAVIIWKTARELALGFHYVTVSEKAYKAYTKASTRSIYNRTMTAEGRKEFEAFLAVARPPDEWLGPRREWAKFVRDELADSRTLDTEKQVALACAAGQLDPRYYNAWRSVRDTFDAYQLAVWHDDSALKVCEEWAKKADNGIIWVEHRFFAKELAKRTGLPYFGLGGVNGKKEAIDDPRTMAKYPVIIASISSNATGRNLQRYNQNLVVSVPTNGMTWEQLLGRTHRDGQEADTISADVFLGCAEHYRAIPKAIRQAESIRDTVGEEQKLLLCDVDWPSSSPKGWAFTGNVSKKELERANRLDIWDDEETEGDNEDE